MRLHIPLTFFGLALAMSAQLVWSKGIRIPSSFLTREKRMINDVFSGGSVKNASSGPRTRRSAVSRFVPSTVF
ncbi:hypothetical protein L596_023232 [Steinernema carpocapsae]|uniref:Uncharacterized protein n=1 Tax=Steinernema carpocapsae TaxID=34508 RepID=A0A4U5MD13_STECR|nr:hypothetical protein L596_023232 [Steinernema carpocapsae]